MFEPPAVPKQTCYVFTLCPLSIPPQLHIPTPASIHLVLEVVQYFWVIWTVLELSKLFWTAAAIPILTIILIIVMLECGVNTDSTQVTLNPSWYVTAWNTTFLVQSSSIYDAVCEASASVLLQQLNCLHVHIFHKADRFLSPISTWTIRKSLNNPDVCQLLLPNCVPHSVDSRPDITYIVTHHANPHTATERSKNAASLCSPTQVHITTLTWSMPESPEIYRCLHIMNTQQWSQRYPLRRGSTV